jgi:hypothetical protein
MICKVCKIEKQLTDYYKYKDCYRKTCKECFKANVRKWAKNNKEKVKQYTYKWRSNNKEYFNEYMKLYKMLNKK